MSAKSKAFIRPIITMRPLGAIALTAAARARQRDPQRSPGLRRWVHRKMLRIVDGINRSRLGGRNTQV